MSTNPCIIATYYFEADSLKEDGNALTYGQSIGNPYIRTPYDASLKKYLATWHNNPKKGLVVRFPIRNFDKSPNVSHLLSVLMGGQMDIGSIHACVLTDLDFGKYERRFPKPRYGVAGIRQILGVHDRPLLGGIIKPKIGLSPKEMAKVCNEMALGGVDFIKEDEILSDQTFCHFKKRVPAIRESLQGHKVIYAPCITTDGTDVLRKAKLAKKLGASAIHLNWWSGFGAYKELRLKQDLPIFFQKSGDKIISTGHFSISSKVLYKLINLIGCDFAHIGMFGGYLSESLGVLREKIEAFYPSIPSFSCGVKPELVKDIVKNFGKDIMITSGGYIHGHPLGIQFAVKELKKAIYESL